MKDKKYAKWGDFWQNYLQKMAEKDPMKAEKMSKYENLALVVKDYKKHGIDQETIQRIKEIGIITGELTLDDLEEAQRYDNKVKEIYNKDKETTGKTNLYEIVDKYLHPVKDADLRASLLFCNPEVRKLFGDRLETLYRAELLAKTKRSDKEKRQIYGGVHVDYIPTESILGPLEEVIRAIPREEFDGDAEYQRRLRQLIKKKAERETFKYFKEDSEKVFKFIDNCLEKEKSENIREIYKNLKTVYEGYTKIKLDYANPNFENPRTKEKGVLPSLHQKIGIYHIVNEGRFGIFDGCGTGKTAQAALAKPLIEEKLKAEGKKVYGRAIIVCPYQAIESWEKGLVGDSKTRYFAEKQNIAIINEDSKKRKDFVKFLKSKDWIIVNYEQLPTKVNGKTLAEVLIEIGYDFPIFDEVHEMRSKKNITKGGDKRKPQLTYSAAARLLALQKDEKGKFKPLCILSGTPMPDHMDDYAIPYHLLMPEKCPDPTKFMELYEKNPRILYTFTTEKTLRRRIEEISDILEPEEEYVDLKLDNIQRKIHDFILTFKPKNYNSERIKALVDPRLVDPEILREIGLLGKVSIENSAKYKKSEEILCSDDGPIAHGEKVIIFSSSFKRGITREYKELKNKYISMGLGKEYETLGLEDSIKSRLEKKLKQKFGGKTDIEILDGEVSPVKKKNKLSERDKVCKKFWENPDTKILLCTTDTGGQSLDFSNASWAIHLDEDYSPSVTEQANGRLLREGQSRLVRIRYLRGADSLDELITQYVNKKGLVIKMAMDGYPRTYEEEELLKDYEHKGLEDFVRRSIGGLSINLDEADITSLDDFENRTIINHSGEGHRARINESNYETTVAQEIRKRIWQNPQKCWFDPEFANLYNNNMNNLSVYVVQRAKVCDLMNKAKKKEIIFPKTVLSDGSGPSLLYNAYQTLDDLVKFNGFVIPVITDRDFSPLMLEKGNNPNKILGDMTGKNSKIPNGNFEMVDNESITLLPNCDDVKKCLMEENRILKPNGLLELVVKNWKFKDEFYSGMEKLGFKVLSRKSEGLKISNAFYDYLREKFGEHYADSYSRKLDNTFLLLAQKIDKPASNVSSDNFWFEIVNGTDNGDHKEKIIVKDFIKPRRTDSDESFRPVFEVKADKWGTVISAKKIDGDAK